MTDLIQIPKEYNYVAAFLTLSCNFRCPHCINGIDRAEGGSPARNLCNAETWTAYLNRLDLPSDLPITLQGGEPSLHPEFHRIIQGVREDLNIDLLTNLSFDVKAFSREIPPKRLSRKAPYASIRVTYHPGQSNLDELLENFLFLRDRQYSIGLYAIRKPGHEKLIEDLTRRAETLGIDFRTKEYLGFWRGKLWGTFHYEGGVHSNRFSDVLCRTSELLIGPNGRVYRCHRDLYLGEKNIGSILGAEANESAVHRPAHVFRDCDRFGDCNPCDLKRKTNRFQLEGHASVEVKFLEDRKVSNE